MQTDYKAQFQKLKEHLKNFLAKMPVNDLPEMDFPELPEVLTDESIEVYAKEKLAHDEYLERDRELEDAISKHQDYYHALVIETASAIIPLGEIVKLDLDGTLYEFEYWEDVFDLNKVEPGCLV